MAGRSVTKKNHSILFLPYPDTKQASKTVTKDVAMLLLFLASPLLNITNLKYSLNARNRSLNPLGKFRNIRQNFGTDSKTYTMSGYITPVQAFDPTLVKVIQKRFATKEEDFGSVLFSFAKTLYLKKAVQNQKKFFLMDNNDFDIVTIDNFDYEEDEYDPYIYKITLQVTSVRFYDEQKEFYTQLIEDGIMAGVAQAIVSTGNLIF